MDRPLRKICFFYFILIFRLLQQQKLQATNPISSRGRGKAVMAGPLRKIYGFPSGWLLKKGRQGGEISVLASKPVLPLLRLSGSCIRFYIIIYGFMAILGCLFYLGRALNNLRLPKGRGGWNPPPPCIFS